MKGRNIIAKITLQQLKIKMQEAKGKKVLEPKLPSDQDMYDRIALLQKDVGTLIKELQKCP